MPTQFVTDLAKIFPWNLILTKKKPRPKNRRGILETLLKVRLHTTAKEMYLIGPEMSSGLLPLSLQNENARFVQNRNIRFSKGREGRWNRSGSNCGQYNLERRRGAVLALMARITKCDHVFFRVVPKQAPRPDVVNLEILQRPASLAAPTVAVQDSLAECGVRFRVEAQPRSSLPNWNRRIPFYPSRILLTSLLH